MTIKQRKVRQTIQQKFLTKQDAITAEPGILGTLGGIVNVPGRPNYVYVRMVGQPISEVYNVRVPPAAELPVLVGYDPLQPGVLQVLSARAVTRAGEENSGVNVVPGHGTTHGWMASDPVFIDLRQFLPLRITPAGGMTIAITRGIVSIGGGYTLITPTGTVDLSASKPTTAGNAVFVLVTIDTSGDIITTLGSEFAIAETAPSKIPAPPADTAYVLGAVFLYAGQITITETHMNADIVDMRFPMPHGLAQHLDLPAPTAGDDGKAVVWNDGAGRFEFGEAGGGANLDYAVTNVSNPPTQEEITTAFGAAFTMGAGFVGLLNDGCLGLHEYLCLSDGNKWLYVPFAVAASSLAYDSLTRYGIVLEPIEDEGSYIVEPSVMIESGLWKMWYRSGFDSTNGIGYATSPDGINWTRHTSNPVLTGYFCPFVFKDGTTYHLYSVKDDFTQIDHYTSSDGVNWTIAQAAAIPLGSGGSWDDQALGNIYVWKEGTNDWRTIYEAKGGLSTPWKLGYATSTDGNTWTKSGSNPVISESGSRGGPFVYKRGTTYYLWCHFSSTGFLPTDLMRYHSTNLTSWISDGTMLERYGTDEGSGESVGQIADPHIVVYNGAMYLYYEGSPDGLNGTGITNIKLATGKESLIWE